MMHVLQDPYRVWFFNQTTATHSKPWKLGGAVIPPTGNKVRNGTVANSVIWTPDRKVKYALTARSSTICSIASNKSASYNSAWILYGAHILAPRFEHCHTACRYISVGYCVDRINSNTPNGTMKVAVPGFFRAAGQDQIWELATNPVVNWLNDLGKSLRGEPPSQIPYEDLPEWWKKLPDGRLRGAENYYK
jgi:hypothetical protein